MKVIICGGGTAGHVYPGLALAEALRAAAPAVEITWIGTAQGIEAELVADAGYKFKTIKVIGLQRSLSLKSLKSIAQMGLAALRAWVWLRKNKPAVVVGMGGYVSLPFMLAARGRYPMVILEQNSVPGLANRVAGRWAKLIAATYEESRGHFSYPKKVIITGNPVRRAVLNIDRNKALQRLSLSADKRTILIFGGSRGARRINQAAVGIYPIIRKQNNIQIIHITGKQEFERTTSLLDEFQAGTVKVDYHLYPYIKEIWLAYAAADLIVGRAGATTLAEITAAGLPAILIPYPYATDNHQLKNATVLKRAGAAEIVLDNQINSALLWEKISDIIFHEDRLNTMSQASLKAGRPAAAERIAELILEAAED